MTLPSTKPFVHAYRRSFFTLQTHTSYRSCHDCVLLFPFISATLILDFWNGKSTFQWCFYRRLNISEIEAKEVLSVHSATAQLFVSLIGRHKTWSGVIVWQTHLRSETTLLYLVDSFIATAFSTLLVIFLFGAAQICRVLIDRSDYFLSGNDSNQSLLQNLSIRTRVAWWVTEETRADFWMSARIENSGRIQFLFRKSCRLPHDRNNFAVVVADPNKHTWLLFSTTGFQSSWTPEHV